MEKILFLDMDGAGANSTTDINNFYLRLRRKGYSQRKIEAVYDKKFKDGLEAIFPGKARLVSKIIAETNAKIVWSTSWRVFEPYKSDIESARKMLIRHNMPGKALIGYTPQLKYSYPRSAEIKCYLRRNFPDRGSCRCAVLDDMADAGFRLPGNCRFFKTTERYGLTRRIADDIIEYFNQNKEQ